MDWLLYSKSNQEMVDKFTRLGIIESSEVEKAFRCVSRAAFVPEDLINDAFRDTPIRGSHQVHMSAPHMYAAILEELELDSGMSFLNIGSGTGYFSTLAGYILKKEGTNHGIELHEELVRFSNDKIQNFLENGPPDAKDICWPIFIAGNCCRLDTNQAKYDRLYCGASCTQANVKFLLELVKVGGFLIAPVGSRLIKVKRVSLKEGRQSVINHVSFAPLVAPTPEDDKLPKLRFPDQCRKKKKQNSIFCDVSFPVCKSPARKFLTQLRAFQNAIDCIENGLPLPMAFCYVPCCEDMNKAKVKQKKTEESKLDDENQKHIAVDSQIDFFVNSSQNYQDQAAAGSQISDVIDGINQDSDEKTMKRNIEWEHISTDKTWFKILEHYYSLCSTTESRRKECFKLKMENPSLPTDSLKILTFKKYAKKMGLIPSKSNSTRSEVNENIPKVEEVASDIVNNLLEEVISQVDDGKLAESFIAAITNNESFRRRSSVAKAIILDNLPRLRSCSQENKPALHQLPGSVENEAECNASKPNPNYLSDMESTVYRMIDDIDKQILNDIALDHIDLEEHSVPSINDAECSAKDDGGMVSNAKHENETGSHVELSDQSIELCNSECVDDVSNTTALIKNGEFLRFSSKSDADTNIDDSENVSSELKQQFSSFFKDDNIQCDTNGNEDDSMRYNTSNCISHRFNNCISLNSNQQLPSNQHSSNESALNKPDLDKYKLCFDSLIGMPIALEGVNDQSSEKRENSFCDDSMNNDKHDYGLFTDEESIKSQEGAENHLQNEYQSSHVTSSNKLNCKQHRHFIPPTGDSNMKKEKCELIKTSLGSSFKKKNKLQRKFKNVNMDVISSEMLRMLPGASWDIKHDKELVLFLSRKANTTDHVAFSPCCSNVIKPEDFTNVDLIQYKRICSFPATSLATRAITLKRIAKLLDSVMNSLVGPSLSRDQFTVGERNEYVLASFNEISFESSGMKLNKVNNNIGNDDIIQSNVVPIEINNGDNVDDKGHIESIDKMMQQEIDNICKESELLLSKLDLYEKLNEEYEIQKELISNQVDMIEEYERLLQQQIRSGLSSDSQNHLEMQQKLNERKQVKKLLRKRHEEIVNVQLSKNAEQKALIQIHNQLDGLENKLVEERNEFLKMGQSYLRKGVDQKENFSKLAAISKDLIKRLNDGIEKNRESLIKNQESKNDDSVMKNITKNRYHPEVLLSKCRFLFPLTSKRFSIMKELLRTSESYSNHPCYVARVDRRIPLKDRHKYPPSNTVFMQLYNSLKNKELNYRDAKKNFEKLWEVKFLGEGIIDQGGGFRDSLAEVADELCPAAAHVKPCLSLFMKSPNQRNEVGDHRDAYIPNPSCKDFHLYTWVGKLMGTAFRTDETIPLAFPPFIWKLLVGEHVTWASDYIGVDETIIRVIDGLELLDVSTYQAIYESEQFYMTYLSDETEKSLIKDGRNIVVKSDERKQFANLVRKERMMESVKQVEAMKLGLTAVVPESILSCLTWQDLERSICGSPIITINDLKANCRYYEFDLSPNDDRVRYCWEAISGFSPEERSRFIRFVSGRKRLPSPFFLSRSSSDKDSLPTASTCGSNLFLPNYSNASVAAEKIRYAINNCVSIDTDTSPW